MSKSLPELLEDVCTHSDCPDFLKHAIFDSFGDQNLAVLYTKTWWEAQFEALDSHWQYDETEVASELLLN